MTKEEFEVLQLDLQQSGKSLMSYLKVAGVKYSTYTYWRRKLEHGRKPEPPIAPISLNQSPDPVFTGTVPAGATVCRWRANAYERKVRAAQDAPLVKVPAVGDSRIREKKTTAHTWVRVRRCV